MFEWENDVNNQLLSILRNVLWKRGTLDS